MSGEAIDLTRARELKTQLEQDITELVRKFEDETNLSVDGLVQDKHTSGIASDIRTSFTTHVTVEVSL